MGFKKLHKMGFAVICKQCHIINGDVLSIVFFYIFQNSFHFFERLCLRGRCGLFFLPVGDEQKKEQKQMPLYRKLIPLGTGRAEQVDLADALRGRLIPGERRGQVGLGRELSLHKRRDKLRGAQVSASGYEQIRLENDIFVFHDIIAILLDGVELSRADDDDIAGCDRALLEIRGHDAPSLFYYNELHFRVPVKRDSREVTRDGAQIGVIGKICRGVRFCLVVILVFIDIHKINLALIVLYNEKEEYCKIFSGKHTILLNKGTMMFRKEIIMKIQERLEAYLGKPVSQASNEEIYGGLLTIVQDMASEKERTDSKKKLYYISAEFLIGKLLSNNMINLGIYQEVKEMLEKNGKDICEIEEAEAEPSLGNGGLGRLAACFLDSIATLGLAGDGIGLNYHLGLFKQEFEDHLQKETPNPWIGEKTWLKKTDVIYPVQFKGLKINARMYDIEVTGYNNKTNKLHLFDIDSVDETIVHDGIEFDKEDIEKNLTLFLYPDDSDEQGRLLRIYQQYFMVSAGAQLILDECEAKGCTLYDLPDYAVIQINDTHPTMVIPELIRLLTARGMDIDDAVNVVAKTCAYTNHTILAEALEKWPVAYLKKVVPQLMPIIEILDDKVRRKFEDESVSIIDRNDTVHMAHIDIHYGFSVNGVAALHTEILKNSELNNFYRIYPEKFNNKTNGITFRRWLLHCNPLLAEFLDETIGEGYKKDASELEKLLAFKGDEKILDRLLEIKHKNKEALAAYLKETQGIEISPDTIFDIQVKRLHEYKRQQLNALYIIDKYLEIKAGKIPSAPVTAIFGAKAAPAYVIAKDIIHLILCLQEIINNDPEVSPYLKVVMVENYNVTKAGKLIPACDISEQISLASKEASGTGNMKFMLNGAVTLGTEDGANVEIHEAVGDDNIFVFGASSDEVIEHYAKADYVARTYYEENPAIKAAIDFITSEKMLETGCEENLTRLKNELINKDWFMTLLDFDSYKETKEKALAAYADRKTWAKMTLVNIAKAGFFSSDRTIEEYNKDIWKLQEEK